MSNIIPPSAVTSPKLHWSLIMVLDDGQEQGTKAPGVALALGRWDNSPCLGIRWNGTEESPIGTPQSRGIPTWFILPEGAYSDAIIETLPADKQKLARTFLPK